MKPDVHVPTYRRITACGAEELAAHQRRIINISPGVAFARAPAGEAKRAARDAILDLLRLDTWRGPLRALTMPGLEWKLEGALLKNRLGGHLRGEGPGDINLTCIENDRAIYHAALLRMPGLRNERHVFRVEPPTHFAERAVGGLFIGTYYFGNVDDLMADSDAEYDFVWLDYNGPLSAERMRVIRRFYEKQVTQLLVITALKARWNKATSEAIARFPSHNAWVKNYLAGEVQHDIEYADGTPMAQLAVRKMP